jgi:hypothetical protein
LLTRRQVGTKFYRTSRQSHAAHGSLTTFFRKLEVVKKNNQMGINIPVVLNDLISGIHVAPTSPVWLAELLAEVSVYSTESDHPIHAMVTTQSTAW